MLTLTVQCSRWCQWDTATREAGWLNYWLPITVTSAVHWMLFTPTNEASDTNAALSSDIDNYCLSVVSDELPWNLHRDNIVELWSRFAISLLDYNACYVMGMNDYVLLLMMLNWTDMFQTVHAMPWILSTVMFSSGIVATEHAPSSQLHNFLLFQCKRIFYIFIVALIL